MEKVSWTVDGMTCTNCALTIQKYLEKEKLDNVKVNFIGSSVSFDVNNDKSPLRIAEGIERLGYHVESNDFNQPEKEKRLFKKLFKNHLQRFLFCAVFTIPMLLAMLPGVQISFLMNPYLHLALTIPVFIIGITYFGKSALRSLLKGVPNMDVLISLGATAAFVYSLYGTVAGEAAEFMFYETTAAIFTFIFFGNWLEHKSVQKTQAALRKLSSSQKVVANMIAYDDAHEEHVFPVESTTLKTGDLILIKSGEQVPADCKILWGDASLNEAIVTGESIPVEKKVNDILIGGSILESGTVKAYVTEVGENSVMGNILKLVSDAQIEKPPVQQLADRISAVFVPAVMLIAIITLFGNYSANHTFGESLLRSIAVLVIACPCAMGLATPAAVAVGLGRAAQSGVLFKDAKSLEVFKDIKQVVFDKTGTLTTGNFKIKNFSSDITEEDFKLILFSLEKYSNHPIAKSIAAEWKQNKPIRWKTVEEIKGIGMKATDNEGNSYAAGSFKIAKSFTEDLFHNIYVIKNDELIGWIDVTDTIRNEAKQVISYLKSKGIKTILLSGDKKENCETVAQQLHMDEVIAEQTPHQKMKCVAALNAVTPTAMVGDGINDAPALAKATVGISLSEASQVAMQSAQVILMNNGLKNLPLSLGLGKHTYLTIKQNLFWAFIYNIVALPVAAFGFLSPTFGALVMGFSDVVLAVNSVRLKWKNVM